MSFNSLIIAIIIISILSIIIIIILHCLSHLGRNKCLDQFSILNF